MSASRPSATLPSDPIDEWDAFITTPSTSNSSPPSLHPTSSSLSGEFNMFSFVGCTVATRVGGNSAGRGKRFLLVTNAEAFCFGSIGGSKICIRPLDEKSCRIPTHGSRKAKVIVDTFYVMENNQKAYAKPKLHAAGLSYDQHLLLQSQELARDQWTSSFLAIEQGNLPDWLLLEAPAKSPPEDLTEDLQLESPVNAAEKTGIFNVFPALSYDDDALSGADSSASDVLLTTEEVTSSIRDFRQHFAMIKKKWTSVFQELEANHMMVATDLVKLSYSTNVLTARIGSPPDPSTVDVPIINVWHTLTQIYLKV